MKDNKPKISIVGYLNTKPFIFGLIKSQIWEQIELSMEIPSVCAMNFKNNLCDIALVPVAILPELDDHKIITDFCIGSKDYVDTVCLYSNSKFENIHTVYLDNHSRTSVKLIQILNRNFWKKDITFIDDRGVSEIKLKDGEGKLMIGDKTIGQKKNFKLVLDLGHEWFSKTGNPFVFAVWVSKSNIKNEFVQNFNNALKHGVSSIDKLKYLLQSPHKDFDLQRYYTEHINYEFGDKQKEGLKKFLSFLEEEKGR